MKLQPFVTNFSICFWNLKQQLDIEARRSVRVAQDREQNLAVEDPKLLANLKPRGKIALWAKSYFANRVEVFPAKTSQTCSRCSHCDPESRVKSVFQCSAGGNRTHADMNAGRVIAQKGSVSVDKILAYRSGAASKQRSRRAGRAA